MEDLTIKDILDLGLQGILIFQVLQLWARLNKVTDAWLEYMAESKRDRVKLGNAVGADISSTHIPMLFEHMKSGSQEDEN